MILRIILLDTFGKELRQALMSVTGQLIRLKNLEHEV